MSAADVMKRENRRFSVINEVAKALDEIAALESDARKQAELIIAEAEAKAAQIVADALNETGVMVNEVKARLALLEPGAHETVEGCAAALK
jgi:cell division septum initiation protein DivIVA